jgi:hypothetical protein
MEIEFSLGPDDLKAFFWHRFRPRLNRGALGLFLLRFLPAIVRLAKFGSGADNLSWVAVYAGLGLAPGTIHFLLRRKFIAWAVKRGLKNGTIPKDLLGTQRITISPETFTATTEQSATTFLWSGIQGIEVTEGHAFFYTGPAEGYLLPAHAFADKKDFVALVETAKRYWERGNSAE